MATTGLLSEPTCEKEQAPVEIAETPLAPLVELSKPPYPFRKPFAFLGWIWRTGFGLGSLWLLLSVTSAIPILNFWTLGYFIAAEGRVATSGSLFRSLHLMHVVPRFGGIVLGAGLWLMLLSWLSLTAAQTHLISPGSPLDLNLSRIVPIAAVLIGLHLCLALARGGSLSCFFRPLKNIFWLIRQVRSGHYWEQADVSLRAFVAEFHVRQYMGYGFVAAVAALIWLFIPTLMLTAVQQRVDGLPAIVSLVGGFLSIFALSRVPVMQARYAARPDWHIFLQIREARREWAKAPVCWTIATVCIFALTLPLYIVTAFAVPGDARWLVALFFVALSFPGRVLGGWACYHSSRREKARWYWRYPFALIQTALMAAYVLIIFFSPYISHDGRRVLFVHHALALPLPY